MTYTAYTFNDRIILFTFQGSYSLSHWIYIYGSI